MKIEKAGRFAVRSTHRHSSIREIENDDLLRVIAGASALREASTEVCVWVNTWVDTSGELHNEVMTHVGYPSPS